jgi:hypothetical protein
LLKATLPFRGVGFSLVHVEGANEAGIERQSQTARIPRTPAFASWLSASKADTPQGCLLE